MAKKKTKKKTINNVNNDVSPIMMAAILIIFIIGMVFVTFFGMKLTAPSYKFFSKYNTKINNNLRNILKEQREMDEKIKELSINGDFKFDDPCVIKNPYKLNPLTAVIIFNTEEETRVEVSINDEVKTKVERSKYHIIPLYGLYSDSLNTITLKLEDGSTHSFDLQIEAYDNNIYSFDVKSQIGKNDIYYMVGNVNENDSKLRGFDRLGNMISYISFDYIGGLTLYKNKMSIAYNQTKDVPNDLRLDIDYMGRISYITSNTNEINYEPNISGDLIDFVGSSYYLYSDMISNYTFDDVVSNDSYDPVINELDIDKYEDKLIKADTYKGEYAISYMEDFIGYKIDKPGKLLIVTSEGHLYEYNMDTKGIIRQQFMGNKALYAEIDGTIYSLRTTLVD